MMPLSEPKKTTVWFREGPASLSATMRVRRYLEGKNDGEGKSVSNSRHRSGLTAECLTDGGAAHGDEEQQRG